MGLDMNPAARPLKGHEAEFYDILFDFHGVSERSGQHGGFLATLFGGRKKRRNHEREMQARADEISEPAYLWLNAPVVGESAEADAWLEERIAEATYENGGTPEQFRAEMQGFHVFYLLPDHDGFPPYSNAGLYEGVDRYTFRGAFLNDCLDVCPEDVIGQAWAPMTSETLAAFGQTLCQHARHYAEKQGVTEVLGQRLPPADDINDPKTKAHIVDSCGRWCLWWSGNGFGLEPYF